MFLFCSFLGQSFILQMKRPHLHCVYFKFHPIPIVFIPLSSGAECAGDRNKIFPRDKLLSQFIIKSVWCEGTQVILGI